MHVNRAPDPPPCRPCIRDYAELVNEHLPPPLILKLTPLKQLRRRLREIVAEHPRFREEAPLVLASEERRRQQLSGVLVAVAAGRSQVA